MLDSALQFHPCLLSENRRALGPSSEARGLEEWGKISEKDSPKRGGHLPGALPHGRTVDGGQAGRGSAEADFILDHSLLSQGPSELS